MDQSVDSPPTVLPPRSLASFISIARSELQSVRERRLAALLLWVGFGLLFLAWMETSHRFTFLCSALLIFGLGWANSYFQVQRVEDAGPQRNLGHLFRFLNHHRAKAGLDSVVSPEMLSALEVQAQIWEQIENGLQNEIWISYEELKAQIQGSADKAMAELVALGVSAGATEPYSSWGRGWDENVARLREILIAMRQAERFLMAYQRQSDLTSEAPFPETPEFARLLSLSTD